MKNLDYAINEQVSLPMFSAQSDFISVPPGVDVGDHDPKVLSHTEGVTWSTCLLVSFLTYLQPTHVTPFDSIGSKGFLFEIKAAAVVSGGLAPPQLVSCCTV